MNSISPEEPRRTIDSASHLKQLNLIAWGLLFFGFVLPFAIIVIGSHRPPDGDFAGFYSLGRIFNTHPMKDLYDYELLKQVCTQVHPRAGQYGPLPYPPEVGLFFAPFALLPYSVAYTLWLLISLALYAGGLKLLIDRFLPLDAARFSLLLCIAFSYSPFLVDDAFSGQIAVIGFFALALVLREDNAGRTLRSGLFLSLCIYKPTLLILLLPMLLVTRRFKTLLGFTIGAATLSLIPTAIAGFGIWTEFFRSIFSYGKVASGSQATAIRLLVKYVDLSSFSALVHGGRSRVGLALLFAGAASALIALLRFWWIAPQRGRNFNSLLWGATITWTMLLNLYVPIYDSILVLPSLILTVAAVDQLPGRRTHNLVVAMAILILVSGWFTVRIANVSGVQLLTVVFAALGIMQLVWLRRIARQQPLPA